jgi:hemolysin-activating ACP:hemolysin acyltransferase
MDIVLMFEKFGLPVAFLIIMVWLFIKSDDKNEAMRKEHREERKEWNDGQQKLQGDTNQALKDLTRVITHLEIKK